MLYVQLDEAQKRLATALTRLGNAKEDVGIFIQSSVKWRLISPLLPRTLMEGHMQAETLRARHQKAEAELVELRAQVSRREWGPLIEICMQV